MLPHVIEKYHVFKAPLMLSLSMACCQVKFLMLLLNLFITHSKVANLLSEEKKKKMSYLSGSN